MKEEEEEEEELPSFPHDIPFPPQLGQTRGYASIFGQNMNDYREVNDQRIMVKTGKMAFISLQFGALEPS